MLLLYIKLFLKNKEISGTSLPASFSAWFLKKSISIVIFYYLTKFHCLVAFTSWDIRQYVCWNNLLTRQWRHKFSNQTYLFNVAFFSKWPKSQDKNLNTLRTNRAFNMKDKITFFIILKCFNLKEINQILWKVRIRVEF